MLNLSLPYLLDMSCSNKFITYYNPITFFFGIDVFYIYFHLSRYKTNYSKYN